MLIVFMVFTGAHMMAQTTTESTTAPSETKKVKMQGVKRSEVKNKINANLNDHPSKRKVLMTKKAKAAMHATKESALGTKKRKSSDGLINAGPANAKLKMRNAKLQKSTNVQSE